MLRIQMILVYLFASQLSMAATPIELIPSKDIAILETKNGQKNLLTGVRVPTTSNYFLYDSGHAYMTHVNKSKERLRRIEIVNHQLFLKTANDPVTTQGAFDIKDIRNTLEKRWKSNNIFECNDISFSTDLAKALTLSIPAVGAITLAKNHALEYIRCGSNGDVLLGTVYCQENGYCGQTLYGITAGSGVEDNTSTDESMNGVFISPVKSIPSPNSRADLTPSGNCARGFNIVPKTPLGMSAQNVGWHVMNEISLGELFAITAYAAAVDGTSGSCYLQDSVVFASVGDAEIYEVKRSLSDTMESAVIAQNYRDKAIRIHGSAPYDTPIAVLNTVDNRVHLSALPDVESECNGAVSVPNILGDSVSTARTKLLSVGWVPMAKHPVEEFDFRTRDYQNSGFAEFLYCSGTGFAFCTLGYQNQVGATLKARTIGEASDPNIIGWNAECDALGTK